jgi:hypothetical protein
LDPFNSTDTSGAAPTRSVLFNRPPAPLDQGALERDLANPDQTAQSLGVSDLPITKSGVPYFPPPVPPPPRLPIPSVTPLDAARFLSPYLVDYFTKTLPPPPPFFLPAGWQAHHINQNAVYDFAIPRNEGLSVAVPGNAFSHPGSSHYSIHELLEQEFWNRYRLGGSLYPNKPTNGEYGQFGQLSYIAGGFTPPQAFGLALQAAAQRAARGLSETDPVPRIPGPLNQKP